MPVERAAGGTSLIDVLDRVLDKGIVIDAWVRVSIVGIDLITVEARVVVASIDTYLKYSEAVGAAASASRPGIDAQRQYDELAAENEALRAQLGQMPDPLRIDRVRRFLAQLFIKTALVTVPPTAARALTMPAPKGAPGTHRPASDATIAAHIVPTAIVARAHEGGDLAQE